MKSPRDRDEKAPRTTPPARDRRGLAADAAVLVGASAFHVWYAAHAVAPFDVGLLLDGAQRVRDGQVWGVDFWAPYGPLRYLMVAAWFAITGASVAHYSILVALLQGLCDLLLFRSVRRWSGPGSGLLAAAMLALAHGALHKTFFVLALLLAMKALEWVLVDRGRGRALAAGALCVVVTSLRFDIGAFTLGGVVAGLLLQARRAPDAEPPGSPIGLRLRRFAIGLASLAGPIAAAGLLAGGSLSDWWSHELQRVSVLETARQPFPWPLAEGTLAPAAQLALFAGIVVSLAVMLIELGRTLWRATRRTVRPEDGLRCSVALLGLLALNQTRLGFTDNRLFQVLAPVFFTIALSLAGVRPRMLGRSLHLAAFLALFGWVHFLTTGPYPGAYTAREPDAAEVDLPRAGMLAPDRDARLVEDLVREIRSRVPEGQPLAAGPGCEWLGFLADRPLVVPFTDFTYYFQDEARQQLVIEALEEHRPELFVYDARPIIGLSMQEDAPELMAYLSERYRPQGPSFGPYQLCRRKGGKRRLDPGEPKPRRGGER